MGNELEFILAKLHINVLLAWLCQLEAAGKRSHSPNRYSSASKNPNAHTGRPVGLEGILEGHLDQTLLKAGASQSKSQANDCHLHLNTSNDKASTASLGGLFQCLTTL